MENVVLIVHLILALCLVGVVLLQRSEGGGLGLGGGGGGGVMSGRQAATALAKLTWIFAAAFICTSIALTVFAAQNAAGRSVIDTVGAPATGTAPLAPVVPGGDLLPPATETTPAPAPRVD
jgi:preprotein translocase subunit SecG